MEERLRFVARLLEGEAMAQVCREFGISRKTGYKIFNRYKEYGFEPSATGARSSVGQHLAIQARCGTLSAERQPCRSGPGRR